LIAPSSSIDEKLGAFGFLAGKTFQGEGGAGNAGLLDQMAALNWTRKYISYLGGDPNRYNFGCPPLSIVSRLWESQLVRVQYCITSYPTGATQSPSTSEQSYNPRLSPHSIYPASELGVLL